MNLQNGYTKLYTDRIHSDESVEGITPIFGTTSLSGTISDTDLNMQAVNAATGTLLNISDYKYIYSKVDTDGVLKIYASKENYITSDDITICLRDTNGKLVLGVSTTAETPILKTVDKTTSDSTINENPLDITQNITNSDTTNSILK